MIPIKRLALNAQYWFVFENYKVFAVYAGRDKNIIKLTDAYVYFPQSKDENFTIEEYAHFDARQLIDIKINDTDDSQNYSKYYQDEQY